VEVMLKLLQRVLPEKLKSYISFGIPTLWNFWLHSLTAHGTPVAALCAF